jgi:hypothetical protein
MITTTVIVVVGQWSQDKPITARIVVGGGVASLALSVMNESAPQVASRFALLLLVIALFTYGPAIAWKFGLLDHKTYKQPPTWRKS